MKENKKSNGSAIKKIMSSKRKDIIVKEKEVLELDADSKAFHDHIHHFQLLSLDDVKAVGILPESLSEKDLIKAVQKDNKIAREWAQKSFDAKGCGCDDKHKTQILSFDSTYKKMRKESNTNLAELLSREYKRYLDPTNNVVRYRFGIISRIWSITESRPLLLSLMLANDITIHRNSTFRIGNNLNAMDAANLKIYQGGKLAYTGNNLFFRCLSAEGQLQ